MKIISIICLTLFFSGCDAVTDNNPAEKLDSILMINLQINEESLNILQENKFSNIQVPSDLSIEKNIIPVYVEPQGAGSRYFPKWGYTITCRDGYSVHNLSRFNLSIQQYDKTKIRTTLASKLYEQAGFQVFYSDHCFLQINKKNQGLYLLTERIEDGFFEKRNIKPYELIKVVFGAKFSYSQVNTLKDNFEKKIPDDGNLNNLAEFIFAIDTTQIGNSAGLSKYIDIDHYLLYHALTTIMNNSDGITNNFYLFKEKSQNPYRIIPWDFDKTFDPKASLNLYGGNELMEKLMQNDELKSRYILHLKNILSTLFNKENLYPIIDSVYKNISEAYSLDPYLNNSVSLDSEITYLKNFIVNRRNELLKEQGF